MFRPASRTLRRCAIAAPLAATSLVAYRALAQQESVAFADQGVSAKDKRLHNTPTSDLLRTCFVYNACQVPWIVDHSPAILSTLDSIPIIRHISNFVVKHTFFAQFVGGETIEECMPVIRSLRSQDIGTLLVYSVEVAHDESEGHGDNPQPVSDEEILIETAALSGIDLAKPKSARRVDADDHVAETVRAIQVCGQENLSAVSLPGEIGSTWVAVKLTGLMADPSVLHRASNTILALRKENKQKEVYYPGSPTDLELALLYSNPAPSYDLPKIKDGVSRKDLEELRLLWDDMRTIMGTARQYGVRITIDAEHSWYQPAIDAFTTVLSSEFNKYAASGKAAKAIEDATKKPVDSVQGNWPVVQPLVYGTYQSYLRRNIDHMNMAHAHAEANNYAIGVKLVRGAYHGQESTRWVAQGNSGPTPVWETKPKTDDCFNASLDWTLDHIKKDVESLKPGVVQAPKVGVLFGTHNVDSCSRVTAGLVSRGLAVVEDGSDEPEHEGLVRVNEEAKKRVMIGQLYGMCDELTNAAAATFVPGGAPILTKYLPYGGLDEVLPYLGRRAIENKTVLKGEGGATAEVSRAWGELKRRWFGVSPK